jgi:hypothetical protein
MQAVNDRTLIATATLLIGSEDDQDEFRIVEEMLYNMINRRKTVRMQEDLKRLTA